MKSKLLVMPAALAIAFLLAFRLSENNVSALTAFREYKKKNVVRCSPDWNQIKAWIEEVDIPPMPGSGNHKWNINTTHDSAQFYFNQGINMYYGFHIIEAIASFKKAAKFDSSNAMIYWAQALALGPNINDGGSYQEKIEAFEIAQKATTLGTTRNEKDKLLIESQLVRYSADVSAPREQLNQKYADKMKIAYSKYGSDPDIAALYADAMMLQHPWDLWYTNGKPKEWTPEIREVLEKILNKYPEHPGANHYYIHVMEPSPFAAKALPSADRLGQSHPGLSHLVHMPSHIYLRTGNYEKGASVNEDAVKSYSQYLGLYDPVAGADFLYVIHNLHMQTNNAMMQGRETYSLQSAEATAKSVPKEYFGTPGAFNNYLQYVVMTPVLAKVRFGKWNELLSTPRPEASQVFSMILYHFGIGMASVNKSNLKKAKQEVEALTVLMKDTILTTNMPPFSPALEGAKVAEQLLRGSISLAEKKYDEAVAHFETAVKTENNMVYNEPRDWLLNPKHYLGNAYLKAGQWSQARKVFQDDLEMNNENGWALFGLYQALMIGSKRAEADKMLVRAKKAFAKADTDLHGPVF